MITSEIPNRLFFIWFGNTQPKYVDFCIQSFKRMNPQFEIVFLRKTVRDIEQIWFENDVKNEYDKIIKKCCYDIIYECGIYTDYIKNQKNTIYKNNIRFIQLLSDIVRMELINEFGGIYLDCDTFPFKPFDDKLLKMNSFCVYRHYLDHVSPDNYFMGSKSKKHTEIISNPLKFNTVKLIQTNKKWFSDIDFWKNRGKFFKCELNEENIICKCDFYIEHYSNGSWNNKYGNIITIPFSKMDKIYSIR